jgi:spermidine synthase
MIGIGSTDVRAALRYLLLPLTLILISYFSLKGPIKASLGQIYEKESAYNYIQVIEQDGVRYLLLNEGQGIHSVYEPGSTATLGTWDYFLSAPYFNAPPMTTTDVSRLGIVGLAAGTIAKQYTQVYGPIPIDGWEIDPEIVDVGRRFFDMNEPNLNVFVADGRWGLEHSHQKYDVIAVDAYRLPYIPWHLTTREFFLVVRGHMRDDGVLAINVGRTPDDRRIINAFVGTLESVFPSVYVVDVPDTFNTIVYATLQPTTPTNLADNLGSLVRSGAPQLLLDTLARTIINLKRTPVSDVVFTDDRAPIEQLTNAVALRFILGGDLSILK